MAQGIKMVALGLVIGLSTALLVGRFINNLLYGVSGDDPVALAVAIFVLLLAGVVACFLPAWRATRINPITALRE